MTASEPEISMAQIPDVKWAHVPINPLFADDLLPRKAINQTEEPPGKLSIASGCLGQDPHEPEHPCRDSSTLHTSCTAPKQQAKLEHGSHIPLLSISQHIWQFRVAQRRKGYSMQPCTI